jgi:acylglycerol lipase
VTDGIGQVSDDPRVEEDFFADRKSALLLVRAQLTLIALCYHGLLRVATGLSCLEGMDELVKRATEIDARK